MRWVATLLVSLVVSGVIAESRAAETKSADAKKPNILVILTDDTGWGEYGFQGSKDIPTPNIDTLAKNGVRFTQGYVSGPYCSPTRAGLHTGRYQTRFGHEFNSVARHAGLSLNETTIADRLKKLGYKTGAIGKWHLGEAPEYRPFNRGYDEFFGTLANTPFYHPTNFIDTNVSKEVRPVEDDNFYTTDEYAKRAVKFIDDHKNEPWFLYIPFNAQHAPLQAPDKYLNRFKNINDERRQIFAAMMSAKDDAVGAILKKLRDLGQEENTLIFFLADNGGPTRSTTSGNGPLRGFKAQTWEGGVRVPFVAQWKGHLPAGKVYENPVIQLDILPTVVTAAGGEVDPAWKLDGVDLLPYLTGKNSGKPHETLYWRFGEQWAIRHGDHKLVVAREGSGSPELYNLSSDISESTDLAKSQPDKVKELLALYEAWNAEQAPPSFPNEPAGRQQRQRQNRQRPPVNPKRPAQQAQAN